MAKCSTPGGAVHFSRGRGRIRNSSFRKSDLGMSFGATALVFDLTLVTTDSSCCLLVA